MERTGAVIMLGVVCALALAAAPVCAQDRWAVTGVSLPATIIDAATGMEFSLVKGGCFEMGDFLGEGDQDEKPLHEVCLNYYYYLSKREVTNEQFKKFIDATGYRTTAEQKGTGWGLPREGSSEIKEWSGLNWKHPLWPSDSVEKKMDHPVVQVSWHDAKEFAKWLSAKNNRAVRLPSEAEWEFAARNGGKNDRYSWGDGAPQGNVADLQTKKVFPLIEAFGTYDDGFKYTAPAGSFRFNELALYDMTGNVWEWCEDWYDADYYDESPRNKPTGPVSGQKKVIRGGSWSNIPRILRTTNRDDMEPGQVAFNVGFRVAIPLR